MSTRMVPAGNTVQISKVKAVTPEPATLSLLALGGLGMLFRRRK